MTAIDWPGNIGTWTAFVSTQMRQHGIERDPFLAYWLKGGRPVPYGDSIAKCALRLQCSQDQVTHAAYGMTVNGAQEFWLIESTLRRRARERREAPARASRATAWRRAHSKFQGDREAFRQHRAATLAANMAKAMAAQGKALLSPDEMAARSLRVQRNKLKAINQSLARIERELKRSSRYAAELQRRAQLPWRLAGFTSADKWIAATDDGKEWQRLAWQVRTHARDAKIRSLPGSFGVTEWRSLMSKHGYRCTYCGRHRSEFRDKATRADMEMDHIYPIGHPWARNDESNIVPACKACNTSKGDRDLLTWAKGKGIAIHPWAMQKYQAIYTAGMQESACQA